MRSVKRLRATLLVACLIASAFAAVNPTLASAQDGTCTTDVYPDPDTAKSKFEDDCGQPFLSTPAYGCEWVPGGWVCEGPGQASSTPSPPRSDSSASKPPAPSIVQVEKELRYVNVTWRLDSRIRGVNVHRNGQFLASVSAPNNVYNDFSGYEGAVYELVAYGYDTDEFSDKAVATAQNDEMDPVLNVNIEVLGENRVVLNWTRTNHEVTGWRIYRNGYLWRFLPEGQGHKDEIFDNDAGEAFVYEVQAVRGSLVSPREGTLGPAVDEYVTVDPTGRARVEPWKGNDAPLVEGLPARDATTRSLAATAEASSAIAQEEHEEFELARNGLATAVGSLGLPQTGSIFNPRNWFSVGAAGIETRAQRMEAEAANVQAFEDLKAYEDCMASNCGAPPPNTGGSDEPTVTPPPVTGGCNESGCWPA